MSSVARGTAYERHVVSVLRIIGIRARRRGGAGDGGVDIVGSWGPNQLSHDCDTHLSRGLAEGLNNPILVQCKHHSKPLGPSTIRELISALDNWSSDPTRNHGKQMSTRVLEAPSEIASTPATMIGFVVSSTGLSRSANR